MGNEPHMQTIAFHLTEGSEAINFCDPEFQPPTSLGSIGPDGFIRDDGPQGDENHHSVGCNEGV